jgi:hypothetical protein
MADQLARLGWTNLSSEEINRRAEESRKAADESAARERAADYQVYLDRVAAGEIPPYQPEMGNMTEEMYAEVVAQYQEYLTNLAAGLIPERKEGDKVIADKFTAGKKAQKETK